MMIALGKICQSVNVVCIHLSKGEHGLLIENKWNKTTQQPWSLSSLINNCHILTNIMNFLIHLIKIGFNGRKIPFWLFSYLLKGLEVHLEKIEQMSFIYSRENCALRGNTTWEKNIVFLVRNIAFYFYKAGTPWETHVFLICVFKFSSALGKKKE